MSKRETVRRDVIAQRTAAEVEAKDSPRSRSIDMDAIPTNTSTTKPAVDDAAILGDQVMWSVGSPAAPTQSFDGESVCQAQGSFFDGEMVTWEGELPSMTPYMALPYANTIPVLAAC